MRPVSAAPFPAPPDIEPAIDDDRLAPVEFKGSGRGRYLLMLGVFDIGEIRETPHQAHAFTFVLRLPGVRQSWSRPLQFSRAQDLIVTTVRDWIEGSGIAGYLLERARERAGDRRGRAR